MMQGPQMQQLRQRVIASYHLGPLDKGETRAYIEHRLSHVGWQGDPRFEPAALELIHVSSGGVPRQINTLCNRLMLAGYLGEKHTFSAADVQAIAREISEDLGPDAVMASDRRGPERELIAVPAAAESVGDSAAWLAHFRDIEERLGRLEKTLGSTIRLLQKLLEPERVGKPRTPVGR
jgi:hypothetical protein